MGCNKQLKDIFHYVERYKSNSLYFISSTALCRLDNRATETGDDCPVSASFGEVDLRHKEVKIRACLQLADAFLLVGHDAQKV